MNLNEAVLSLKNITKRYPGVVAIDNVSIDFYKGEVHALIGENGAGKSTLIKTISGAISPDEGSICFSNKVYSQMTPHLSKNEGVEVIYQEFNLVDSLSAAENICLGEKTGKLVDSEQMIKKARNIFKQFNIDIDPNTLVRDLKTGQQQIVEIAKAVSKNVKILVMDEPSAPLSVAEVECMFEIIGKLKEQGVTIIYISHRIEELFRISDRVTVMRDGQYIETKNTKETSRKELIGLMVGRELKESYPSTKNIFNDVILEVKNLSGNGDTDISFKLKKGEILGFAGLLGAGRTELVRVIFGADKKDGGEVLFEGKPIKIKRPQDAIKCGIGLIPEDRKQQGCFLSMDIKRNISFTILKQISKMFIVDIKKENELAEKYSNLLKIKTPSLLQNVINLSGGNQQKVVLAKSLAAESKVLIFDEPTRGIDVGAKQEIYNLMCRLADEGIGIIMISSDMEELLGMSDRIIVLSEGRIAGEVYKPDFKQDYILDLASGIY